MKSAKDIIGDHAAEFGLGESAQVDLLCNFLDQQGDGILEDFEHFVEVHADELEGDGGML